MARVPQNSMDAYLDVYDRPTTTRPKNSLDSSRYDPNKDYGNKNANATDAWFQTHGYGSAGSDRTSNSSGGGGYQSSYVSETPKASDFYSKYIQALKEQQRAAELQKQAQIDAAVGRLEAMRPGLKTQYEQGAQQAYIQSMLAKRDLPQQLAAQGLSGGLAESSNLALDTAYQQSRNDLLGDYNAAVNDLNSDIAQVKASGDLSLADTALEYQQKIADAALQAEEYQRQLAQSYAKSGAGASYGNTGKPNLTLAQAQTQLENGNYSEDVLSALEYYTGARPTLGRMRGDQFYTMDQIIAELSRAGYTDEQIANELNRNPQWNVYRYR